MNSLSSLENLSNLSVTVKTIDMTVMKKNIGNFNKVLFNIFVSSNFDFKNT